MDVIENEDFDDEQLRKAYQQAMQQITVPPELKQKMIEMMNTYSTKRNTDEK